MKYVLNIADIVNKSLTTNFRISSHIIPVNYKEIIVLEHLLAFSNLTFNQGFDGSCTYHYLKETICVRHIQSVKGKRH